MKWRRTNIGASTPYGAGLYFSWGNIDGHQPGSGYSFSQETYNETQGASIRTDLTTNEDAAHSYYGDGARIPSVADFQELTNYCSHVWSNREGVLGLLFTSSVNGNKLFIPAAGWMNGENAQSLNIYGHYWSRNYDSIVNALSLSFNETLLLTDAQVNRYYGYSIRAVFDPNL